MDLGLEIKGSKLVIKWQDVKADCYRVFLKNDGNFCECARVSGETEIRLSIVPYGDGECFVVAVKDGLIIDKSSIRQFTINARTSPGMINTFLTQWSGLAILI